MKPPEIEAAIAPVIKRVAVHPLHLPPKPPVTWRDRLIIAAVFMLCAAAILAISKVWLLHASIRLDEAQSLWQTSHSYAGTLRTIAQDVHVPLYHMLLHTWQVAFGQSIETARMLSLLFYMATLPVAYLLARRFMGTYWSLFALILFSLAPFLNWYANEARMYTMLLFISTVNQYFFVRLIESRGRGRYVWTGYVISAMTGAYTHYFFLLGLAAQGLYVLLSRRYFVRRTILKFSAAAGLLLLVLMPWILYFRSQGSAGNTSPLLQRPSSVDVFNVFSQFSFGFQNDTLNTLLVSPWPVLVIFIMLGVVKGARLSRGLGYMLVAGLVPVLLALIISYTVSPLFVSRYMIACLLPLLLVLVWLISTYRRRLAVSMALLLSLLTVATAVNQYTSASTPVREDYRAASDYIRDHARSTDVVVLSAPFIVYPFNYYYDGAARVATLPQWDRTVPGPIPAFNEAELDAQVKTLNKDHQYIYLLLSNDQGYQEQIFQYYEQRFENTVSRQFSPDFRLEVYRVGYSTEKPAGLL